jgi:pyruvate/2-oxoglutarate dehydrogenase complex dihydrolipoamide dehydrogenase (E3) component
VIRARRYVIATGSRPFVPPVPGLDPQAVLTNESVFEIGDLPRRLLVIGGGPIGLELAQAFRRLGSAVTVVEAARPLANDDAECAAVVVDSLAAEGIRVISGAGIVRAETDAAGIALVVEHDGVSERLTADRVLSAAGRVPNVADLGLQAAGIEYDNTGIAIDAAMRTTNRRVFAIGDVTRSFRFTHWAGYQGGLVVRSILTGWPHRENRDAVVWATYTDPELAHVGLAEQEARRRYGTSVTVHRANFSGNDRAQADRRTEGFLKLVIGRRGRVLGADIVGVGAADVASLVALAITGRLSASSLAALILPYPTIGEVTRRAAIASLTERLGQPSAVRALAAVRWFGRRFG